MTNDNNITIDNASYDKNTEEILDSSWISNFEAIDSSYNMFYKDDVEFIHVNYVYLSNNNEIERVKCENIILPVKNMLTYDVLVSMVNDHKEKIYKLAFMLKYNFSIEPEDVKFMKEHSLQNNYLVEIDRIDNICYERTINMFQDLNELTLFFTRSTKKHTRTQKIHMYNALKRKGNRTKRNSVS
jgi:hypothetical protein